MTISANMKFSDNRRSVPWDEVMNRVGGEKKLGTPVLMWEDTEMCDDCVLPDCFPARPDCLANQAGYVNKSGNFVRRRIK